ncbi:MAG: GTPase [Bryobacteraceae bacterium]
MPANLTPDYLAAERDYKSAATPAEKIAALERMMATLPKHKGTEKMQADIRRRLSQARKETAKKGAHATPFYVVPKEGAAQVALVGPPNAGKSQLLSRITHARPEVADYPFTTRVPRPGMMPYEDVNIQIVDLPPLSPEFMEPWLPQVIRAAHLGIAVVDVNDATVLDEMEFLDQAALQYKFPPPRLLLANKIDLPGAEDNFTALEDLYGGRYRCMAVSALTGRNLDALGPLLFEMLELVRVYTKVPGRKADLGAPYVVRRGQTVIDVARLVHKDFAENLKYARLFHPSAERDGMAVERDHPVQDRDILEFHI